MKAKSNLSMEIVCQIFWNVLIVVYLFPQDNEVIDIYALLALTIGFRFIAYLFLLKKAYKKP